jgi:hypothetical protein
MSMQLGGGTAFAGKAEQSASPLAKALGRNLVEGISSQSVINTCVWQMCASLHNAFSTQTTHYYVIVIMMLGAFL